MEKEQRQLKITVSGARGVGKTELMDILRKLFSGTIHDVDVQWSKQDRVRDKFLRRKKEKEEDTSTESLEPFNILINADDEEYGDIVYRKGKYHDINDVLCRWNDPIEFKINKEFKSGKE